MDVAIRRRLEFVAGFAIYFGALWFLWSTPVVYPLKVFVVLMHEVSHGLVALATGGSIQRIAISADQGGACYCPGGSAFLTLSAGYLGSMAWGAGILAIGRVPWPWPRRAAIGIGGLVVAVTLLFVRNLFGVLFGFLFGALLVYAGRALPRRGVMGLLMALGLTSCLYAILDIKSDIIDRPQAPSDAQMLAQLTGVPTVVWGVLWIGLAIGVAVLLFRFGLRTAGRTGERGGEILPA